MKIDELRALVQKVATEMDADLLAFYADIDRPQDDRLISLCRKRKRRKNLVLLLTTRGGDPNAAFRIGRCLQMVYSPKADNALASDKRPSGTFSVFVNSLCKSAGTLLALSADKLIMTGNAELGPLDIQLRKPDEVGERTSGLTPVQAIQHLQIQSTLLFKNHFRTLRFDADLTFSTKMAAEIATKLTTGLLSPIYEQIDPIRLAEVNRSLSISSEYAQRLDKNLKPDALDSLVTGYPSHGFVIDREEAKTLFKNVEKPSDDLFRIGEEFKIFAREYLYSDEEFVMFLNDMLAPQEDEENDPNSDHDDPLDNGSGQGGEEASEDVSSPGSDSPPTVAGVEGEDPSQPIGRGTEKTRRRNRLNS